MEEKQKRGFAAMTPERVKEICAKGGKSAHAKGTAHRWTTEQAREAGRKGGLKTKAKAVAAAAPAIPPAPAQEQ